MTNKIVGNCQAHAIINLKNCSHDYPFVDSKPGTQRGFRGASTNVSRCHKRQLGGMMHRFIATRITTAINI